MDILEKIVEHKRGEVEQFKSLLAPDKLYGFVSSKMREETSPLPSMRLALETSRTGIIAEFKRMSPSKGWICENGRADEIPLAYQQNGAAAVSILTDTAFFGGYDDFVLMARTAGVTLPVLYKNFVVDEYQLLMARYCGASAVLLIAACLSLEECKTLLNTAHGLGLEVLLEIHDERELDYTTLPVDMIGVNNRNLGTFETSVENSFRMINSLPEAVCKVSESGIDSPETIVRLREAGYRGFLVGEHFMRQSFPGEVLGQWIEDIITISGETNKQQS